VNKVKYKILLPNYIHNYYYQEVGNYVTLKYLITFFILLEYIVWYVMTLIELYKLKKTMKNYMPVNLALIKLH
jgi:hypothetical protein